MVFVQVKKVKAIYYTMNKFRKTDTGLLMAEGWVPMSQLNDVDIALKRGTVSLIFCSIFYSVPTIINGTLSNLRTNI